MDAIQKFRNVDVKVFKVQINRWFSDSDFQYFFSRCLFDAECVVRGAGGSLVTATDYVNTLRTRAGNTISQGDLNLNFTWREQESIGKDTEEQI
jgi:hypothetical protein